MVVLLVLVLGVALLASRIPTLRAETGYRAYLGNEHPTVIRLDQFIDDFGGGLPIIATWSCEQSAACETVFDSSSLAMAHSVVRDLSSRSDIIRIESPATTQLWVSEGDSFGGRTLYDGKQPASDIAALAARAVADPLWRGLLVSPDGLVGAIVLELSSSHSDTATGVLSALEGALEPFRALGFQFYIVGQPAQLAQTDAELAADSQRLIPLMIALIAVVVFVLFRSWQMVAASLATVGLSTGSTMGFQAALGWPTNALTETLPPLILVIALSDSVHILAEYAKHRVRGVSVRPEAFLLAARRVGPACLVTSLTTAVGFISFTTSSLESFVRFGTVAAFGMVVALLLSFTVLPILMILLPAERPRAAQSSERWEMGLASLVAATRRRAVPILIGAIALGLVCVLGVFRLDVDVDEYKLLGEQSEIVKGYRFVESHLQKPDTLEIELALPVGTLANDAGLLHEVEQLEMSLSAIDGLGPVHSVVSMLKRTNRLLHDDKPEFERLPDTDGLNSNLLTLLSLRDPGALEKWISPTLSRLRVSVEAEKRPKSERARILSAVDGILASGLRSSVAVTLTGPYAVYRDMVTEIQQTQLSSFATAAVVILGILVLFIRWIGLSVGASFGWALVGMFPTLLPVVVTLGVMGFAGINLDVGTAMVAAIVLGLAVDDAIHLIAEFHRRRRDGSEGAEAIEGAVRHVGRAIVTTSVALTLGFFMLLFSSWQSIASFGFLAGVAIFGALVADLWVLPAIIFVVTGSSQGKAPDGPPGVEEHTSESRRRVQLVALVLPLLTAFVLAAAPWLSPNDPETRLACRVMPNGVIPLIVGSSHDCPLRPLDQVLGVEADGRLVSFSRDRPYSQAIESSQGRVRLSVERDGVRRSIDVPTSAAAPGSRLLGILLAGCIVSVVLAFGIRVYSSATARASTPLLLLFSVTGVQLIAILCHFESPFLAWIGVATAPLIPATLGHLALTFPRRGSVTREAPGVVLVPYGFAVLLAFAGVRGLRGEPSLWTLVVQFQLAFTWCGALVLWINAVRAANETRSALERTRARLLLVGSAGVPLIFGAIHFGWGESLAGGSMVPLLSGLGLFAVPFGYATTRYELFDLAANARSILDGVVRVGVAGAITATAITTFHAMVGIGGVSLWVLSGALGFAISESIHRRLSPVVTDTLAPGARKRRELLRVQEVRKADLSSEVVSATLVGQTLEAGLESTGVAVFLIRDGDCCPAYAGLASPAFRLQYASFAIELLGDRKFLHLARGDAPDSPDAVALRNAEVELLISIDDGDEPMGIILIGSPDSGRAFSSEEIEFACKAAVHTASAVRNARAAEQQASAAERSALGRLVTGIAHDLGTPLRVIERRAERIIATSSKPEQMRAEAAKIEAVSQHVLEIVYGMVDELAHHPAPGIGIPVTEVIGRVVDAVDPGGGRVLVSAAPELPRMQHSDKLARILTNLVENALAASDVEDSVWVYATELSGELSFEVRDSGVGMTLDETTRVFDLFYTTRSRSGGRGIGLSISREIAEGMGWKICVTSTPGEGSSFVLHVPLTQ